MCSELHVKIALHILHKGGVVGGKSGIRTHVTFNSIQASAKNFAAYSTISFVSESYIKWESALINFYYGYQLSKLPNITIHGYMGKLGKHHKLIRKIERVLFN